jgi:hypothetical protein
MVARVLLGTCAAVLVGAVAAGCASPGTATPVKAPNAPVAALPSVAAPVAPNPIGTHAGAVIHAGTGGAGDTGGASGDGPGAGAGGGTGGGGTGGGAGGGGTGPAGGAAPVAATSCAAGTLSLNQPPAANGAARQVVVAVRIVNHASRPCTISGYPAFLLTAPASSGKDVVEPVTERHGASGTLAFGDPVRTVTIPSGGFSGFLIEFSRVPYGDGGCVRATKLRLTLPGTGASVTGPVQIDVCGEPMLVSPFLPSTRLTVG